MKLERIKGNTFLHRSPTNVGVYLEGKKAYVVDTPDERTTRDLIRHLFDEGVEEIVVVLTHSHADHIRGCARARKFANVSVHAPAGEVSFVRFPHLEGYVLYGASPPRFMRSRFFHASPCDVETLREDSVPFKVVKLPGHTVDHTGYITEDGVIFSGDTYFGMRILKKYPYPYLTDVEKSLESLKRLEELSVEFFLPSHGDPVSDPVEEIEYQRSLLNAILERTLSLLSIPRSREELVRELFGEEGDAGMYYLAHSFVGAILAFLDSRGDIELLRSHGNMVLYPQKWQVRR